MNPKYDPNGKTPLSQAEALKLLEIEGNPLTPDEIAQHERFVRDGLSAEEQIEAIKADIENPVLAAE